ncbi:hypothetical protein ABIB75_007327 [Bradyrhizobium sp. GM2.2]
MYSEEADTFYEEEVMLGALDESHISAPSNIGVLSGSVVPGQNTQP